jgi:hypothetical protein
VDNEEARPEPVPSSISPFSRNTDAYWLGGQNDWVCAMLDYIEAGGDLDGLDAVGQAFLTKAAGAAGGPAA